MGSFEEAIAMLATAAFAATGVLACAHRGVDILGIWVLGVVTALGGGTVRDIVLDVPVFWLDDLRYVTVASVATLAVFAFQRLFERLMTTLLYIDAIGLALFGIGAVTKVLHLGGSVFVAIVMGVVTGIGGGVVRDVLSGRETLFMRSELYATPILVGTSVYALALEAWPRHEAISALAAMALVFGLRALAIRFGWRMPHWLRTRPPRAGGEPA